MSVGHSAAFAPRILCLALIPWPSELMAEQPVPIPAAQAQETAKKAAGEIYGERFQHAKTTAEKSALAAEMIEAAMKVQDGSPDQYVVLKIAADVASGAGDAPTALQAVEKLVERFDVPGPKLTGEALLTAARNAGGTSQHRAVGEAALSVADALVEADEYELALSLCESARSSALKTRQYALGKELAAKLEDARSRHSVYQAYREAWSVLNQDATNPAANLAAGRYLCFVKADWDRGVTMLALGSDAELKAVAVKDLRGADSATEQAAIGDAWWDLAQSRDAAERDAMRLRAGSWYQQAEPRLAPGLVRLKLSQRLAEVAQLGRQLPQLAVSPPPAVAGKWIRSKSETKRFGSATSSLAFSPDGLTLVASGPERNAALIDVGSMRVVRTFDGHEEVVRAVAFSPDGQLVATGDKGPHKLDLDHRLLTGWKVAGIGRRRGQHGARLGRRHGEADRRVLGPQQQSAHGTLPARRSNGALVVTIARCGSGMLAPAASNVSSRTSEVFFLPTFRLTAASW